MRKNVMKRLFHGNMAMSGFGCNGVAAGGNEAELRGVGFEALEESLEEARKNKSRIWRE